jgi:F-type H+/Na+-transporting ATPase subunit alpha
MSPALKRGLRYIRAKFAQEAYGIVNEVHGDSVLLSGLAPASPECLLVSQSGSVFVVGDMYTDGRIRAAVVSGSPKPRERVIVYQQQASLVLHLGYLGRVVDSLGRPIDGCGPLSKLGDSRRQALVGAGSCPALLDREESRSVIFTGLKAVDSFYPLIRGQSTVLTGEPGVGKESLVTDILQYVARTNRAADMDGDASSRMHCMYVSWLNTLLRFLRTFCVEQIRH